MHFGVVVRSRTSLYAPSLRLELLASENKHGVATHFGVVVRSDVFPEECIPFIKKSQG